MLSKSAEDEIPWSAMAGAGNVYRHDYEDVQQRLVWRTMAERFPALLAMAEAELRRPDDPA